MSTYREHLILSYIFTWQQFSNPAFSCFCCVSHLFDLSKSPFLSTLISIVLCFHCLGPAILLYICLFLLSNLCSGFYTIFALSIWSCRLFILKTTVYPGDIRNKFSNLRSVLLKPYTFWKQHFSYSPHPIF